MGIDNYKIKDDLIVDVDEGVEISFLDLKNIPVQFGQVNGSFDCSNNNLKSLESAPDEITGNFMCYRNLLLTFEGCPGYVKGDFNCESNNIDINTLKFFDCIVGKDIISDFGNEEEFLNLVRIQKAYAEKEKIEKSLLGAEKETTHLKKRI